MDIGMRPYDCSEKKNVRGWARLPGFFQTFLSIIQRCIFYLVQINNPGRTLIRTSGWRSLDNSPSGGVGDSLHHFGLATDFRRYAGDLPLKVPSFMVCIASGSESAPCWHVQFVRGKWSLEMFEAFSKYFSFGVRFS